MSRRLAVDMHVHTAHSHDGYLSLNALARACRRRNLGAVAVTDHNEIAGALAADREFRLDRFPARVIVGEEVTTSQGEIIGLFLSERVRSGMTLAETFRAIHEQGGLVYLNHPFGYSSRSASLRLDVLESLWAEVDVVEVFNARNRGGDANRLAARMARRRGKPGGAGSDAHSAWEVGRTYVSMPGFDGPRSFLASLARAAFTLRSCPFAYRLAFKARKMLWPGPRPCAPDRSLGMAEKNEDPTHGSARSVSSTERAASVEAPAYFGY
jgi:hypothetical protein